MGFVKSQFLCLALLSQPQVGLNVRDTSRDVKQIDFSKGLPYNATTRLALEPSTSSASAPSGDGLWVGTTQGAARWDL